MIWKTAGVIVTRLAGSGAGAPMGFASALDITILDISTADNHATQEAVGPSRNRYQAGLEHAAGTGGSNQVGSGTPRSKTTPPTSSLQRCCCFSVRRWR